MIDSPRCVFMLGVLATGGLAIACRAVAQAAHVDEADEQAIALGYRHDTTEVDAKK